MRALFITGFFLLFGCTVTAPNPPILDFPETWTEAVDVNHDVSGNGLGSSEVSRWWDKCNDPLLKSLIDEAVEGGPDLQIASFRVQEAEFLWEATKAGFGPSLDFSRSARREDQSNQTFDFGSEDIPGFPSDQIFGVRTMSRHDIRGRWEADLIGRNDLREMVSTARVEDARASYDDAVLLLSTRICDTLADLRESVRQLNITESSIRRNERSLELVQTRFKVGIGNDLELAQARRTLAEAKAQFPQAQIAPRAACDVLAALLGKHPGTMLHLITDGVTVPPAPQGGLTIQPKRLLEQQPSLRRLAAEMKQAAANAGLADAATKPTFALEAALGTESDGAGISFSRAAALWSVALSGATPLFDGGRRKLEARAADAAFNSSTERYRQGVLNVLAEVERAAQQLTATQDTLLELNTAVMHAKIVRERSEVRYTEGISSLDSVLDAEQALDPLERQLASTRANAWRQLANLLRATGGSAEFVFFETE